MHRLLQRAIAGVALLCFATPGHAIDPLRMISQYMRERWGSERGFPGGAVSAIAQTTDGYLWIGTERGLVRFDGLNFRLFQQASPGPLPIGPVQGLVADNEANLWILLKNTKILRYHDGKFELAREDAEFGVTAIGRRRNGAALFSSLAYGSLTYRGGRFEVIPSPTYEPPKSVSTATGETTDSSQLSWANILASVCRECSHLFGTEGNSAVISMTESTDGRVWLGTRDKGLFYMTDGQVLAVGKGFEDARITCLLPLENGELWVGTEKGVMRWDGAALTTAGVPSSLRHTQALAMIRDRDSNIWVGTAGGLVRVNRDEVSFDTDRETPAPVTALYEDREGNLWVGSPQGIERLRDSAFVTYSAGGLQSESSGPVYVDQEGRAWFAPFQGGLHWLKGEKSGNVTNDGLSQDVVYSISGSKRELWIGRQQSGLTHLRYVGGSIITDTFTQADGLAQNSVYAVDQSRDGAVWAGTLSGGVSEYTNRHFTTYTTANGLASNTITAIAEGADDTMWFATPNGISALSKGQWRVLGLRDGMPSDDVNCLLSDSVGTLWIGTASGLAFLNSGHVQVPRQAPASLHEQILGIAEDRNGRLWIATSNHVLAANRDKLVGDALSGADVREYGLEDGLLGTEGVKRHQSVFADPFGRVWFSMNRGLSVVDTTRAFGSSAPAIVQIEGLTADGNGTDLRRPVRISPGGHRVTFLYSGLSLSVPERVRFKYKLDGFDQGWSEPVSNREAVYTNLSHGAYRFHVMASNSDGLWKGSESSISFTIEPAFWQTWWFRLSSGVAIALVILAYTRFRMVTLTRQLSVRFEERLAERTRIARELHDTLLQGFHGLLLRFQTVSNLLPERPAEAKQRLESAIDQAAQTITEGRDAVQQLRSSTVVTNDLAVAVSALGEELAADETNHNSAVFCVEVEGTPRDLHPILRDEVYRIAAEAMRNAFRHAQARQIEVEILYEERQLRLRVRDDGKGVDPKLLHDEGRPGHWGLDGMHERAKLVGAHLNVWSELDSGTEVELRVPASVAYTTSPAPRRWWSFGKGAEMKS
jgi:ligand-binding sensor domain-containing protein/signal transduction histidine kinase